MRRISALTMLAAEGGPRYVLPSTLALSAWLSSSGPTPTDDCREMARALDCHRWQTTSLPSLAASRSSVSYSELLDIMRQQGFTPTAAEDVIHRSERSGAVLNLGGVVWLRPGEVAHALAMALPNSSADIQQQLTKAQGELAVLEEELRQKTRGARIVRSGLPVAILGCQGAVYGWLYYLTYYAYSWDFVEPICYFVGAGQALLTCLYFTVTHEDFSMWRLTNRTERRVRGGSFDSRRYERLAIEVERLRGLLAAHQQREAAAAAENKHYGAAAAQDKKSSAAEAVQQLRDIAMAQQQRTAAERTEREWRGPAAAATTAEQGASADGKKEA